MKSITALLIFILIFLQLFSQLAMSQSQSAIDTGFKYIAAEQKIKSRQIEHAKKDLLDLKSKNFINDWALLKLGLIEISESNLKQAKAYLSNIKDASAAKVYADVYFEIIKLLENKLVTDKKLVELAEEVEKYKFIDLKNLVETLKSLTQRNPKEFWPKFEKLAELEKIIVLNLNKTFGIEKPQSKIPKEADYLQLARQAWNKNHLEQAKQLLKKVDSKDPQRIYLSARINEELKNFESARKDFTQLFNDPNLNFESSLRYFLLSLYLNDQEAANKTAAFIQKVAPSNFNYEITEYFTTKDRKNLTTKYTLYSYYFWLANGQSILEPDKKIVEIKPINSKQASCNIKKSADPRIETLAAYNLEDLLLKELRYQLFDQKNSQLLDRKELTFKRLNKIDHLNSYNTRFRVLQNDPEVFSDLYKNCPAQLTAWLYPKPYLEIYQKAAQKYNLPLNLILALSRSESTFNPLALSQVGAIGLMQLMPTTAIQEGFDSINSFEESLKLFYPENNIIYGAKHLRGLIDYYQGKEYLAIAAYNAGKNAVDRWIKRYPDAKPEVFIELIPFSETRNYVKKVLTTWWIYQAS